MAEQTIAGAEWLVDDRIEYAKNHGLSPRVGSPYRTEAPWRMIWHRTQGNPNTRLDCRNQAISHRVPPHIWASYRHDYVAVTVPLTLSAYALAHPDGTIETNHMRAIQCEVFGFSEWLANPEEAAWLGRRVLGPILAAGYPIDIWNILPTAGNEGYGTDGAVRISAAQWAVFNGQGVHANVPANEHWDTGKSINLSDVAKAVFTLDDTEEIGMYLLVRGNSESQWYIMYGNTLDPIGFADNYTLSLQHVDQWVWSMTVMQNSINDRRAKAGLPKIELFAFNGRTKQKDGQYHAAPFILAQSVIDRML